jgi:hypothetical protein
MDGLDEKEIGSVLTVALKRHLITKPVHLGVISVEDADRVFDKTAESIERPLGVLQHKELEATTILRQFAQSVREKCKT